MSFYVAVSQPPAPEDWPMWEPYMHEALQLAVLAEERGDVPVGAVVVLSQVLYKLLNRKKKAKDTA